MKLTEPIPDFLSNHDAYLYIVAREAYHVALNLYKDEASQVNYDRMIKLFAEWESTNQKPKR